MKIDKLMRLKPLAILLAFSAIVSSCKKNNDPQPEPNPAGECRIDYVVEHANNDTIHITYNNSGKVVAEIGKNWRSDYVYSGDSVVVTYTTGGTFNERITVKNNQFGLATNVRDDFNEQGNDWFNASYEYDGSIVMRSFITSSIPDFQPFSTTFQWRNDNPIVIAGGGFETTYEYDLSKPYQQGDYFFIGSLLSGFQIFKPGNLVKRANLTDFVYEFSNTGKIVSISAVSGNTTTKLYSIGYRCH